jgi:hypothetical protein
MENSGFPLQPHDSEGLGAGTRRPLVPQEVARLSFQSFYVNRELDKIAFISSILLEKNHSKRPDIQKILLY